MFFPKAMTEIELIVPAKDLLPVTKVLSGHGIFHQSDSSYSYPGAESEKGASESWQNKAAAFAGLERRLQLTMQSLTIEEGDTPASDFETITDPALVLPEVERIELEVKNTNDQVVSTQKNLEALHASLSQLESIQDVPADFSALRDSKYVYSVLGMIPAANVDRLETSLSRIPHVFLTLRSEPQKKVVWLAGAQANADVLERAVRSSYLNPLSLPMGYKGTPAEIIKSIKADIRQAEENITQWRKDLSSMAVKYGESLRALYWQIHTSRIMSDAIVRYGRLKYTYVIVGWVLSDESEVLIQRLKQASHEILIETFPTGRSGHHRSIPVALRHSKWLRPFQMLVTTYARPRYGELDPTWIIAIMFPVLFGAMFGDVGQGLILAGLGALMASGKVKALKGMAGLGGLIAVCGLSATVFGFLYGSIFGFEDILHPLWMSPLHNIMQILTVAVGAGVVLLNLAFLIGIMNNAISRNWGHLIFGHNGVAGYVLYLSLLALLAANFLPEFPIPASLVIIIAIGSALAVMLSEVLIHLVEGHRPLLEGGLGTYFIQAPVELFEAVISMLSNTLSFVRVGAFAVAHGGLSSAIFILAGLAGGKGGIGYWIVVLIGNIFIIGFEGLIVGIQTMRLSYYEFFSKFFSGGGMRFEPLTLNPGDKE